MLLTPQTDYAPTSPASAEAPVPPPAAQPEPLTPLDLPPLPHVSWAPAGTPEWSRGGSVTTATVKFAAPMEQTSPVYQAAERYCRDRVRRLALERVRGLPEVQRLTRVREALAAAGAEVQAVSDELAAAEHQKARVVQDVPRDAVSQLKDLNARIVSLTAQKDQRWAAFEAARQELEGAEGATLEAVAAASLLAKQELHRQAAALRGVTAEEAAAIGRALTRARFGAAAAVTLGGMAPPSAESLIEEVVEGEPEAATQVVETTP